MARFLSHEWFDEVEQEVAPGGPDPTDRDPADPTESNSQFVLEQVVLGTPDGDVRYRVIISGGRARIQRPAGAPGAPTGGASGAGHDPGADHGTDGSEVPPADMTFTCDWATATAIALGTLPTQTALTEGRLRIKGNVGRVAGQAQQLIGLDPVPEPVRRRTTY